MFIDESLDRMGGVERVISTLSNSLIDNYDISLLSLYKSNKEYYFDYNERISKDYIFNRYNLKSKKYKKGSIIYYLFRFFEKIAEYLYLKNRIKKYARRIDKEATVVFGGVQTAVKFLPYINCKKIIVREAVHYHCYNPKQRKIIDDFFEEKVDTLIVSSEENNDFYKKKFGNKIKIIKIYNPLGITPKVIKNLDSKVVMSVGRYDTHKGYDYLIRAYKEVAKKYPDWKLHIVGDGYYKENMEKLILDLNLSDNVKLIPATKDVVSELNKASIYVMASRFEGYANALVEAMCCGLPCISYNWLMGVEDIITNNENGLVVKLTDRYRYFKTLDVIDEDVNNLSNAIIKLIEDKKLRIKFSNEAPKIKEKRDRNKIIEKWKEIICED